MARPGGSAGTISTPGRSPRSAREAGGVGHEAQLVEGDDGVIVDHNVERGNPAAPPTWHQPFSESATARGAPRMVTADRGYGEKAVKISALAA
jgi:hypothetical protein